MTLLERTGQRWKIHLFVGLFLAGCAVTLLQGFLYAPLGRELTMQIAIAGVGLIIGSFIWSAQSVTCPECRLKLFVHAFRHQGFFAWFSWLLLLERCPGCGYGAVSPPPRPGKKIKGLKRP